MSEKAKENDQASGAVSALHQITGLVGMNTGKMHEKLRKSRDPDVERGRAEKRAEIRRILERSLVKKAMNNGEGKGDEEVPSLNRDQAQAILDDLKRTDEEEDEEEEANKPPLCPLMCHLVFVLPFIVLFIYFGHTNLENCPLVKLPMWIMWLGIFWAISTAIPFINYFVWQVKSLRNKVPISFLTSACRTLIVSWTFYGFYLMWGNWFDYNDSDLEHPRYCQPSVMLFSQIVIGFIVGSWILTGLWHCCSFCYLIKKNYDKEFPKQ